MAANLSRRLRTWQPAWLAGVERFVPGPKNAITDVPGVGVGHATVSDAARGVLTGVTVIVPGPLSHQGAPGRRTRWNAQAHILHGAGEFTGLHQVREWGLLETPIAFTSTLCVGRVYDALLSELLDRFPDVGLTDDVLIPCVAECDDSILSRARERPVGPEQVRAALRFAESTEGRGEVAEGGVGAGAGMVAFDLKGGIGTSSRRVGAHHVGVLLNANLGWRHQLRVGTRFLGDELAKVALPEPRPRERERSCVVVVATDAPLKGESLRSLAVRAGMGLARGGSFAGHGSGEIVLAFSTAGASDICSAPSGEQSGELTDLFEATVAATEEALANALVAGETTTGRDGAKVYGLREAWVRASREAQSASR